MERERESETGKQIKKKRKSKVVQTWHRQEGPGGKVSEERRARDGDVAVLHADACLTADFIGVPLRAGGEGGGRGTGAGGEGRALRRRLDVLDAGTARS